MEKLQKLLTVQQVSEIIQIHPNSLYRLCYQKRIPFTRLSGMIRFDPKAIEGWVEQGRIEPED